MDMDKQYFLDKLAQKKPEAFKAYSYDLLPQSFSSHDKIPIECYVHGIFEQTACSHLFSAGCSKCAIERNIKNRTLTTEVFITRSRAKHGKKFSYHLTDYARKGVELIITCPQHGDISIRPEQHFWLKTGCPECDIEASRAKRKKAFLDQARRVHGEKFDYSKVDFVNSNINVEIVCPHHGSFWQGLGQHVLRTFGCPECSRKADKLTQSDFEKKAKEIHGDAYDYSKTVFVECASKLTITCKKHGDFIQRAQSHLSGNGCKKCFMERNRGSTEAFIDEAKKIHGNKYDYSRVKYTGNKNLVEIICPIHGSFWQKPNSHISSKNGCRFCSDSKGEREVEHFLKRYGIKYIREYRILPHLYRYDFYLPDFDIYIEFNGVQHYFPVETFGGVKAFEKVKENDKIKRNIVQSKGGFFITITYRSLTNDTVEKDLIRELRQIYRYWFVINGQIQVFRKFSSLCALLGTSTKVEISELLQKAKELCLDFKELFIAT